MTMEPIASREQLKDLEEIEEFAVIAAMLLHGETTWPVEVLSLRPEHFVRVNHSEIMQAITELIADRVIVDEITVSARLESYGAASQFLYLNELAEECPGTANLAYWAKLVLANGQKHLIEQEIKDAQERGANGTAEEAAALLRGAVSKIEADTITFDDLGPLRARLPAELRQLEAEADNPEPVTVLTGIPDLDRRVKLRPGQLSVIAGRPGLGKSALAGTIASNTSKRVASPVALFSLEMSYSDLARRLLSGESGAATDELPDLAKRGELADSAARLHELDLWIDERPRLSVSEIRSTLQRRLPEPKLVIVDYLQLTDMGAGDTRHDLKVGAVTKGLRAIAKDFDCHMIALSQLNRAVENNAGSVPKMSNLRDSGNIEEDADHIWLLYRPGLYSSGVDRNETQIMVEKNRNGETGMVECLFQPKRARFVGKTWREN